MASRTIDAISGQLVLGGLAFGRVLAHHEQPQRCVPDVGRYVDEAAGLFYGVEVLRVSDEGPVGAEPGGERVVGHALDLLERAHDHVPVLGAHGCDAEAAVADHRGRHSVPRRAAERAVPHDLGVVVRVDVDEAW